VTVLPERERTSRGLLPPLLDRLVDTEPDSQREPVQSRLASFSQYRAAVLRDLDALLNARRVIEPPPPDMNEVNRSLFIYGLPDFTSDNPHSLAVKQRLRQDIERTVALFEPRLKNVLVRLEADGTEARKLHFRISGLLVSGTVAEPVAFDTWFDFNRGECTVAR
jgi:type VI secretion system protein ImpF